MKTNELTGAALDWAVAKCVWAHERVFLYGEPEKHVRIKIEIGMEPTYAKSASYHPSTDWAQGGPIIERENIDLTSYFDSDGKKAWYAYMDGTEGEYGPTFLIAAMRCYVASKLGDTVDLPKELT